MERMHTEEPNGARLDGVWASYRRACPDPEANPEFMPRLWQKIEARRAESRSWFVFKRLAQACVAGTAALLLLLNTMTPAVPEPDTFYSSSYADVLAADQADRDYAQALPADLPGVAR